MVNAGSSISTDLVIQTFWTLRNAPEGGHTIGHNFPRATSKSAELSCEIDYAISLWSWILSWKYPHFLGISTFRGYYTHFVEISTFRRYYPQFVYISVFRGNIHVLWVLSAFCGNIHVPWILSAFCVCICISCRLSVFCGNIHVSSILFAFRPFYLSQFTHLVRVTGASLLFLFVT